MEDYGDLFRVEMGWLGPRQFALDQTIVIYASFTNTIYATDIPIPESQGLNVTTLPMGMGK